jgi:hypothetical protein
MLGTARMYILVHTCVKSNLTHVCFVFVPTVSMFDFVELNCVFIFSGMDKKVAENADIIEKSIGIFGRWHIAICLIIFLVKFPIAWHQLSIVFLAPPVNFSCESNMTDECSENCTKHIFDK